MIKDLYELLNFFLAYKVSPNITDVYDIFKRFFISSVCLSFSQFSSATITYGQFDLGSIELLVSSFSKLKHLPGVHSDSAVDNFRPFLFAGIKQFYRTCF